MSHAIKSSDEIVRKLGQVIYVAGMQWGDEGKGKLVDILSEQYDIIARSAGGANAGHSIYVKGKKGEETKKFVFHLLPSGVLHEGKSCVIGNGTVIHVPTLLTEIAELKEHGIDIHERLIISDRAHLVFGYHKEVDEAEEERRGANKVGTTKRGIGPTYTDKIARRGVRVCDLKDFGFFAEKLRANAEHYMKEYKFDFDIEAEINIHRDAFEILEPMIRDTAKYLHDARKEGKTVLAEGAQGIHLDVDFGTYPYVSSSNTTSGGGATGLGIPPNHFTSVVGILKAYTTRVGSGPFPTELAEMEGDMLREKGGEFGATTGRPRRCGWLDIIQAKSSIMLSGINSINLTKLDVLTGFGDLKIGVGYTLDGEPIDFIPASLEDFGRVEVVYETMSGWSEDISKATKFSDLPKNAQAYVERIEELCGVPVNFIGVGMCRDEMILR